MSTAHDTAETGPARSAGALSRRLHGMLESPLTSNDIDLNSALNGLLAQIGESAADTGGQVSFYGKDPIIPSRAAFGAMSALSIAAKSVLVASIWRDRTGQEQDIHVDVRKALRRFSPFIDRKWELVNGYPGQGDVASSFESFPFLHPTADGGWAMAGAWYPGMRQKTLQFLQAVDHPDAIASAIGQWNRLDLERAAEAAGVPVTITRTLREAMAHEAFQTIGGQPLIRIEKIADSDPVPFSATPSSPLDGVRALGLAHVIAGPSIGRALALHGADVLNLMRPDDVELEKFHFTSHVGLRSARLDYKTHEGRAAFNALLADADIFFSNRRHGYLSRYDMTADALCAQTPGLIHTEVAFMAPDGPWSPRVGFDINAGAALGLYHLEGTDDTPAVTPIVVVADYAAGWLATAGTLAALRRRAREGGSYKVTVSLGRTALWLMELGIFDRAYAVATAGSAEAHRYLEPEQFSVQTPMGLYVGVKEMVDMSRTPGAYRFPLNPIGSGPLAWL